MPQISTATTETIYFVASNGDDIVHYGSIEPGSELSTGQPNLEEFATAREMVNRAFNLNPEVFEERVEDFVFEVGTFVRQNSALYEMTDDGFELVDTTP
jgi:hypothetical protein